MPVMSSNSLWYLDEQVAARALDQQHFDLLALESLPVECALRLRAEQDGAGYRAQRRGAGAGLQQAAPQGVGAIIAAYGRSS